MKTKALVVMSALIAGAIILVWAALQPYVLTGRRMTVEYHVFAIIRSLQEYSELHGEIPPAEFVGVDGKKMYSWRFAASGLALSTHIANGVYLSPPDYDSAWDSPKNERFRLGPHPEFGGSPWSYLSPDNSSTKFFAITGPGTAFSEPRKRMRELPDDLIIFAEIRNSNCHWMEPGDWHIDTMPESINEVSGDISGLDASGFWVGFADGGAWLLSYDTPYPALKNFFTVDKARENSREAILGKYRIRFTNYGENKTVR